MVRIEGVLEKDAIKRYHLILGSKFKLIKCGRLVYLFEKWHYIGGAVLQLDYEKVKMWGNKDVLLNTANQLEKNGFSVTIKIC